MKKNLIEYFFQTSNVNPHKIAVVDADIKLNFTDLRNKAFQIAETILSQTKGYNNPIAVFLPKSADCIAADLAITMTGNIYMNLDVKSPGERLKNIIDAIKPLAIITNRECSAKLSDIYNLKDLIDIDNLQNVYSELNEKFILSRLESVIDTDPLCIINTSGSTGTPKGVVLNHRSYINYTHWAIATFHFDGSTRLGVLSPPIFDHFNYELCLMMMTGAELVLLDNNLAMFPIKLLELLKANNVNYIFWVPTIMVNIANMDLLSSIQLPQLKMVWFAGEVFPTKQFNYWRKSLPSVTFVNLYGPTEATVDCTYYIVNRELSDDEPIPIGFPCRNTDILILDEYDKLSDTGKEGELCIRGTALAMGYYNNPEKTNQAFVQNPLNTAYPDVIYRTGDIVAINEFGEILFKGRKDTLIKHLGYRVELGEVEHLVLNSLKMVKNVCALYDQNKKEIVLVYENEVEISVASWRQAFSAILPKYMIPTIYFKIDTMPGNTNGKIDRTLLKQKFC
jgi:amino acid adenylation domain-containing protein